MMMRQEARCGTWALAVALVVIAVGVWVAWGPSVASAAATDLPPLPAKVGVMGPGTGGVTKAVPDWAGLAALAKQDEPAPVDNSPEARKGRAQRGIAEVLQREGYDLRPVITTWATSGNTAQAIPAFQWVDLRGGQ